jgi:hypothetical protein
LKFTRDKGVAIVLALLLAATLEACGGVSKRPVTSTPTSTGSIQSNQDPFNGRRFKQAHARFATCMRKYGVNYPMSDKDPIGINKRLRERDPKYNEAIIKCYRVLLSANRVVPVAKGSP